MQPAIKKEKTRVIVAAPGLSRRASGFLPMGLILRACSREHPWGKWRNRREPKV